MNKEAIYVAIAALLLGGALGYFITDKVKQCPAEVSNEQLDSLSAAVQYHKMMEDSAWVQAARFASQRDSAMNNPIIIKERQQYRSYVQKTLDAGGLHDVLDTLRAPAGEWVISR